VTRRDTAWLSWVDPSPATSATVRAGQAWTRRSTSPSANWSAAPWAPITTAANYVMPPTETALHIATRNRRRRQTKYSNAATTVIVTVETA
jgi:hypothetical protein